MKIFRAVIYIAKGICLIGNDKGEIKIYEGTKKNKYNHHDSIQKLKNSNQLHKFMYQLHKIIFIFFKIVIIVIN